MDVSLNPETGVVMVDGVDISDAVRRVTVDIHTGHQPEVFLELATGALVPDVLNVDAVVHIVRSVEENPGVLVDAWLAGLDPDTVEREALEAGDGYDIRSGVLFVNALRRMATSG